MYPQPYYSNGVFGRDKHCWHPIAVMGVVDTFKHSSLLPVFKKFPTAHPETHPLTQLLLISKLASHLFFSWSNSLEGPWGPSACGQRQRVREEDQRSHRKDFHFVCQQLLRRRWRGPRCMSGELMCRRRNTLSTIESIWNYGVWVFIPKGDHIGCLRRPYLWDNV